MTGLVVAFAVLRHHVIDGRRCEVKKALTKSEMQSLKSLSGGTPDPTAITSSQLGGADQNYGLAGNMPYGMPPGNMGYQQGNMGSWAQAPSNVDENSAAGNYGYTGAGAPYNNNMNVPYGHLLGNMAGVLGSMLANWGVHGGNMAGAGAGPGMVPGTGMSGAGGNPGQNAGSMPGRNSFIIFTLFMSLSCRYTCCGGLLVMFTLHSMPK